jgi:hypothetical protein
MKLHEEFKLWENMWELPRQSREPLNEKWETFDLGWGPVKLWYSDSVSEFRAFLRNVGNTGIRGLRLCIADGLYLAARASDLNHDNMLEAAEENYIGTGNEPFEMLTCGFPKADDFEVDNFEVTEADEDDLAFYAEMNATDKARYDSYAGNPVLDPKTAEVLWIHDGKRHRLIADCGTFEVDLYNFYSKQFPEFKYGDSDNTNEFCREKAVFENSESYFAIKPLIKKLYMTNYNKEGENKHGN